MFNARARIISKAIADGVSSIFKSCPPQFTPLAVKTAKTPKPYYNEYNVEIISSTEISLNIFSSSEYLSLLSSPGNVLLSYKVCYVIRITLNDLNVTDCNSKLRI